MWFVSIFVNREERRLRAGWRIVMQLLGLALVGFGLTLASGFGGRFMQNAVAGPLLYLAMVVGVTYVVGRFIDRRRFASFGFHLSAGWWVDLLFGLLLGAGLMAGIFFTFQYFGWVQIVGEQATTEATPFMAALAIQALGFVVVGINEELMFRGYLLKNLSEGFAFKRIGKAGAIVLAFLLSSALFGLAHAANPGATTLSIVNISLAGLLLALPYMLTGELAIPIGIHITWNFLQGPVFGFPVSGSSSGTRWLVTEVSGPELWTGGGFGPEGGLAALVWMAIGCLLIVLWSLVRRRTVALQTGVAVYQTRNS